MRGWQGLWTPRETQQAEARQILAAVEAAAQAIAGTPR
jgi:hypothetical protein